MKSKVEKKYIITIVEFAGPGMDMDNFFVKVVSSSKRTTTIASRRGIKSTRQPSWPDNIDHKMGMRHKKEFKYCKNDSENHNETIKTVVHSVLCIYLAVSKKQSHKLLQNTGLPNYAEYNYITAKKSLYRTRKKLRHII